MERTENNRVLAICGWSGSGKTTLIEAVLPRLIELGLSVAVIKNDVHGIQLDKQGKDSDRLFRAGADVSIGGPDECFIRIHQKEKHEGYKTILSFFLEHHDLVLIEGHKDIPTPKIWLEHPAKKDIPGNVLAIRQVFQWGNDREGKLLDIIKTDLKLND
ncbi:MAG: molybdopterin-guanine dinucleotide biosynthesis protein B [Candidatus Electryonea clarkiae]|nr:molybdopterin-guanine dinucleotide biosynthesis protein B [Candidatus Electryonea clarkiae]MDP8287784.1 molybdopterin-guanine dinucleotide biosynthesis protein B [Candidatus Electryonea clarkiae]